MAHQRYALSVALAVLLIGLSGCGGGGNSFSFPPPQGGFTNANFSGPFAFSYTGTNAGGFLAVAGSLQADGAGHITSGLQDVNTSAGIFTNASITGTYAVRADGRGSINITSPAGNSVIEFVIVAGGHALITRFDANATGSGTIDQQTASAFSNSALAGQFAFNLGGIDAVGNPLGVVGNFISDATGTITSGVDDSNDSGSVITNDPLSGSIPVSANGRGTASINTARGALSFAYYVVDSTHLKLVETDNSLALGGEAFRQLGPFSSSSVSGPFAFTIAGADTLNGGPFAAGGVLTSDGVSNIINGTEDINDAGTLATNIALTGNYTMAANGRGTLTINNGAGNFNFVIYPSSGGVQALETDVRFVTTGTALQQAPPINNGSLSGTYGMNFTGTTANGEVDSIAQFTADGAGKLSGIIDVNSSGSITFGQALSGTFSVSSNGRTTATLQSQFATQNLAVYVVNANRALFVELDGGLVAAGDIRHQ
jgi:hypothetical protein